ncbi:MAG: histidine kinase [Proteobacteria bacterium]|nr:MAG: histidine kinase [Pseudomonadota bacterium]
MLKIKSLYKLAIYSVLLMLILAFCFAFIILFNAKNELNEKKHDIREAYVLEKKAFLRNDVLLIINFIDYYIKEHSHKQSENELKIRILDAIGHLKRQSNEDYFFIYDFKGNLVYSHPQKDFVGKNFLHMRDRFGKEVISEIIKVSKNESGGYIKYTWLNKNINSYAKKLSYAKSFDKWGWSIGKGVYLHKINDLIKEKERKYNENMIYYISQVVFLGILLILYSLFIYKNVTKVITQDVNKIRKYFENPQQKLEISFGEFQIIANYASKAIKTIQFKREKLENINKNLENIVHEKTLQLRSLVDAQKKFIKYSVHEINTPLSIIASNTDLLKMKHPKNNHITNIESGIKIIECIFNELSYFIKKDRFEYKKEYLNFSQILHERLGFFDQIALSNSLNFKHEIKPDIYINFNPTQLQSIIDNNLSNAIKYSFENSTIKIELCYFDESKIDFTIQTHSKPIENKEKIFDGFYRENEARGGFGLGLGIVKDICDKNLVKININSNKNHTKFTYRFRINENIAT